MPIRTKIHFGGGGHNIANIVIWIFHMISPLKSKARRFVTKSIFWANYNILSRCRGPLPTYIMSGCALGRLETNPGISAAIFDNNFVFKKEEDNFNLITVLIILNCISKNAQVARDTWKYCIFTSNCSHEFC